VKTMVYAFNNNTGFQQDLTSWNVSSVTDHRFFADYSTFPTNLHPKWVR
jgi:surface protein